MVLNEKHASRRVSQSADDVVAARARRSAATAAVSQHLSDSVTLIGLTGVPFIVGLAVGRWPTRVVRAARSSAQLLVSAIHRAARKAESRSYPQD